ncbi:MAG: YihY/virulence factor BrkB family protein [Pseudomonadota bacterium]
MRVTTLARLLKDAFYAWMNDRASHLAAALSFYMLFSLAPLLIIIVAAAGMVFEQSAVRVQIAEYLHASIGADAAAAVLLAMENMSRPAANLIAALVGVVTLLFGAGVVFGELQQSLNAIWKVPPGAQSGLLNLLKDHFLSFLMIAGLGVLLLASLAISTTLAAVSHLLVGELRHLKVLLRALDLALSFGVITLLFAVIYKVLPDAAVKWDDVWLGAFITAGLFWVGKFLLGLYLGRGSIASAYGAAGSLVVILIWVYYTAQILFFGAEFTRAYAAYRAPSAERLS